MDAKVELQGRPGTKQVPAKKKYSHNTKTDFSTKQINENRKGEGGRKCLPAPGALSVRDVKMQNTENNKLIKLQNHFLFIALPNQQQHTDIFFTSISFSCYLDLTKCNYSPVIVLKMDDKVEPKHCPQW